MANLKRNIHYENLQGMTSQCVESGVCLLRPFITIPKEDIIINSVTITDDED